MADLPKLGIVTLLNSMLESRDGDKISPIAEPITLDDLTRSGIIEACSESQGQPCVCGALVKCTAAKYVQEKVHMIKKDGSGRAVKVAHIEQLNAADITRERPFVGCRLSTDGECTIEEEYIEGKAWKGVDRSVRNDPDMKFKQELLTEAVGLLPGADVKNKDVWHRKKQWTLDVNESYMICTHGYGLIYFADAGQSYVNAFLEEAEFMEVPYVESDETEQETEPETEETSWIPSQIMQLGGGSNEEQYLTDRISDLNLEVNNENLKWKQEKINIVWEQCEDFYQEYGVQIDPRMMLAIVIAEGTGSFNTNSSELAADGGNGPLSDFRADCENAIDLVGGKIIAYLQYHDDFTEEVQDAADRQLEGLTKINEPKKEEDALKIDILHYLNWETPRLSLISTEFRIGIYAANGNWHSQVRDIYGYLVDGNKTCEASTYTKYILGLDVSIFTDLVDEKGIDVSQPVTFSAELNENGGGYTVIGKVDSHE